MKKTITLTNKECEVLDDMFMYMVDYMEDRCWSSADKRAFDRILQKIRRIMITALAILLIIAIVIIYILYRYNPHV